MKLFIKLSLLVLVLLFAVTLPFPLHFMQHPAFAYEHFFTWFEQGFCSAMGLNLAFEGHLYSDSPDLWVHCLFLLLISPLLTALILKIRSPKPEILNKIYLSASSFILAFFLIKYGFDKVFKLQFYAPEPNILHTPFGQLDKDILYWSVMGKSYSYSVFSGLLEVVAGTLLLSRKTRKLGALLSLGILSHVLMINIAYGIEVKILSSFLVLLSLMILAWYRKELRVFFVTNNLSVPRAEPEIKLNLRLKRLVKFTLVFYIFFESTFLAFSTGNFNDDTYPRPKFHGSYDLYGQDKILLGKELGLAPNQEIRRIFIHRQNYFIIQTTQDEFIDFAFRPVHEKNGIRLHNRQKMELFFNGKAQNNTLKLRFQSQNSSHSVYLRKLAF